MAKFSGSIGYAPTMTETSPGVYEEVMVIKHYTGDLIRNTRKLQTINQVNDNINVSNEISIVADPYANENFFSMRYVEFRGAKWKITNVDASQYPRLILTVGGLYNEKPTQTPDTTGDATGE